MLSQAGIMTTNASFRGARASTDAHTFTSVTGLMSTAFNARTTQTIQVGLAMFALFLIQLAM